ncbi:MarR family winged helix-turn-helix transcriptional regulator [Streptomyces millisiae]|uniref:MarR family winged helix-turn-helix transcriptional regulator n=1 Tax=Streptomyces millisiae TaxID=3075542 RepID=A0ABU2LRA4_9ACTN|nr:MarR family winged helix-turn-helix transcriptional regulator [Streptomyces sp. DSM 44918]MDT0320123.1 MarR family winged helix-turn-helix transcriptional regulator [Streptomyces sp. DSM 44918]
MATADGERGGISQVPVRLREKASWLITHAATPAGRLSSEAFAGVGARRYHYPLLAALAEFGPASQAALGRRCGIDRSDVVAALNELAAAGQVVRSPDPADRRRNVITLTPEGERQLERADKALAAAQDALLAPLSAGERAELIRLLARVLDHWTVDPR